MMSDCKPNPILDHIRFLLEDVKTRSTMIGEIPHLNLQTSSFSHYGQIIGLHPQSILKTFGSFSEIFFLFVDGCTCMPAEHALHFTFKQTHLCHINSFCIITQSLQEECLERDCLRMIGMSLKQLLCIFETFLVVFRIIEFLDKDVRTASCL